MHVFLTLLFWIYRGKGVFPLPRPFWSLYWKVFVKILICDHSKIFDTLYYVYIHGVITEILSYYIYELNEN